MAVEARFRAMGSEAHIVAEGAGPALLDGIQVELNRLEGLWSRFRTDSEISMLNAHPALPTRVSPETFSLVALAVRGWRMTDGTFDPTVLRAVEAAGYDRSFELVGADAGSGASVPVPGCEGIALDEATLSVTLPDGVAFDPGGIGKGYAADLVARRVIASGDAVGICINIGGDLRVAGQAPEGEWTVSVEDPFTGEERAVIALGDGAVATTSRTRRRWAHAGRPAHHLIDPATGASAWSGLASVTVVTLEAWWAEVLAKAAFVAGPEHGAAVLDEMDVPGLLVTDDGDVRAVGDMAEWLA